jgi:hypothetical protein
MYRDAAIIVSKSADSDLSTRRARYADCTHSYEKHARQEESSPAEPLDNASERNVRMVLPLKLPPSPRPLLDAQLDRPPAPAPPPAPPRDTALEWCGDNDKAATLGLDDDAAAAAAEDDTVEAMRR